MATATSYKYFNDFYTNSQGSTAAVVDPNSIYINFALTNAGATNESGWNNIIGNPGNGNVALNYNFTTPSGLSLLWYTAVGGNWYSGGDPAASDVNGINQSSIFSDGRNIPAAAMYSAWYTFNPITSPGYMFFYPPNGYKAEVEIKGGFYNNGQFSTTQARVIFSGNVDYTKDWDAVQNPFTVLKTDQPLLPNANGQVIISLGSQNGGLNFAIINVMRIKLIAI